MMGNTELIQNKGVWLPLHSRGAPAFNTSEKRLYKARSDSAENKLDPVPFFIYYGAQFVKKIILLYINEMLKSNINQSRLYGMGLNSPYNSQSDVLLWIPDTGDETNLSVWNF